jgi:phospholipase C
MKLASRRLAFLSLLGAMTSLFAHAQTFNTPLQHVIVVVQENRTPDNLFGADQPLINAGAHLVPTGNCQGKSITLTTWRLDACFDPDHSHKPGWLNSYDSGKMDGSCTIGAGAKTCTGSQTLPPCQDTKFKVCPQYTVVDNSAGLLNPYFQLASQYGFANYMFQTNQGPSFIAHQFLFSGTSAPVAPTTTFYRWFSAENLEGGGATGGAYGCTAKANAVVLEVSPTNGAESAGYTPPGNTAGFPCYEHRTLSDVLEDAGISWRYYTNGVGSLWNAPATISHICQPSQPTGGVCNGPAFQPNGNVQEKPAQVLLDLGVNGTSNQNCNLPQVSWVIPDGAWSDHPGTVGHDGGPSWVAAIVNAVGGYDNSGNQLTVQCNYWANTAILVTWDDWGGFYDDVNPITTMGAGYFGGNNNGTYLVYGFRVPLLVVSPFAKQGYISGPASNPTCPNFYCHDFGSILNFIEYAFGSSGNSLQQVGYSNWHYADHFTQDTGAPPNNYSLYDFFNFSQSHSFTPIMGAKYTTDCFLTPKKCFTNFPADPDSDAEDRAEIDSN